MRRLGVVSGLALLVPCAGGVAAQQRVTLPEQDRALTERPAPVWSVGSAEGNSWELLSNVRSAVFDAEDNLYALDMGNHRVLVFDRAGKFVRSIGKQGGGPGEFQFPMSLALTADGRLVVGEGRGFSIFRRDGTFERLVPSGGGLGALSLEGFAGHPDGGVIARTRKLPEPGDAPPSENARMPAPIVHLPLKEGAEPDTVIGLTEPMPKVQELPAQGGRRMRIMTMGAPNAVFSRQLQWAPLPDGRIAVADVGDDWEVRVAEAGRYTHVLTRPLRGRAATERDRERAREATRERLENGGTGIRVSAGTGGGAFFVGGSGGGEMTPEQIEQEVDGMTFAERIPVIQDLFADAGGRLWVKRAPAVWGDPSPVDLIAAADGRYIGTVPGVELPLAVSRSGLGAWVERDELEVEKIVVRRLPASWK